MIIIFQIISSMERLLFLNNFLNSTLNKILDVTIIIFQ